MRLINVQRSAGIAWIYYIGVGTDYKAPMAVWRKERLFLFVRLTKTADVQIAIDTQDEADRLTYRLTGNKRERIELTSLINDNSREVEVIIPSATGSGTVTETIQLQIVGDCDFRLVQIPHNDKTTTSLYQVPPYKMYDNVSEGLSGGVTVEIGTLGSVTYNGEEYDESTTEQYQEITLGEDGEADITINQWRTRLIDLPCNVPNRMVTWCGRLGANKTHYWLLKDRKLAVADSVELVSYTYDERKSSVETATLYLDDLCEYDVYYYADIITSDSVNIEGDNIKVLTSNITYPNGLERGSVEVEVELHRTQLA